VVMKEYEYKTNYGYRNLSGLPGEYLLSFATTKVRSER